MCLPSSTLINLTFYHLVTQRPRVVRAIASRVLFILYIYTLLPTWTSSLFFPPHATAGDKQLPSRIPLCVSTTCPTAKHIDVWADPTSTSSRAAPGHTAIGPIPARYSGKSPGELSSSSVYHSPFTCIGAAMASPSSPIPADPGTRRAQCRNPSAPLTALSPAMAISSSQPPARARSPRARSSVAPAARPAAALRPSPSRRFPDWVLGRKERKTVVVTCECA
jgi:hypothetical protein